jgi:hypothetical protein
MVKKSFFHQEEGFGDIAEKKTKQSFQAWEEWKN